MTTFRITLDIDPNDPDVTIDEMQEVGEKLVKDVGELLKYANVDLDVEEIEE